MLDVGCGCGATSIAAAHQVAPAPVVGLDLSGPMLELARRRAPDALDLTFVQADAQIHAFEPGVDVIVSRFGTMFFDDPVAAFANLARALRPGGRLCLATWQPLEANDWLLVPGAALLRYASLPTTDDGAPGMFSQADPDRVGAVLRAAGWHDVRVEPVTLELTLGANPADAADYLADTGTARRVLETISEADRPRALHDVTDVLADHVVDGAVRLGAGINLVHAWIP